MIRTILGLIFNRSGRKKYADMHGGDYVITGDLMGRPVIASKKGFIERGDDAFSPVRHDGFAVSPDVYIEGKGK